MRIVLVIVVLVVVSWAALTSLPLTGDVPAMSPRAGSERPEPEPEVAQLEPAASREALDEPEELVLPRDEEVGVVDEGEDLPPEYSLIVTVVGESGEPVPGALVWLSNAGEGLEAVRTKRLVATDFRGVAQIEGRDPGVKTLIVEPGDPAVNYCRENRELEVLRGRTEHLVRLVRGQTIAGRLAWVSPSELRRHSVKLELLDGGNTIQTLQVGGEQFEFTRVPEGAFKIRALSGCSPFESGEVRAGTRDLVLELKALRDPRPVGLRMAEIHGVVAGDGVNGRFIDAIQAERELEFPARAEVDYAERTELEQILPIVGFHCAGLEPGRYFIVAIDEEKEVARVGPFDLAADDVIANVELRVR